MFRVFLLLLSWGLSNEVTALLRYYAQNVLKSTTFIGTNLTTIYMLLYPPQEKKMCTYHSLIVDRVINLAPGA